MAQLSKRATIYLEPELHKALKIKAAETSRSISEIINDIVKTELREDAEDLKTFEERASEPTISYESFVKQLKADGKI
jgi:plasmid stability protein